MAIMMALVFGKKKAKRGARQTSAAAGLTLERSSESTAASRSVGFGREEEKQQLLQQVQLQSASTAPSP